MKPIVVQVVVEGETERDFVKQILNPYFYPKGLKFQFNLLHGVSRWGWERVRNEIAGSIYDDPNSYCTTMLDLYGLPENTPGKVVDITEILYCGLSILKNRSRGL